VLFGSLSSVNTSVSGSNCKRSCFLDDLTPNKYKYLVVGTVETISLMTYATEAGRSSGLSYCIGLIGLGMATTI
jgi:hypothetical protein